MFRKISLKTLFIIFSILLVLVVATNLMDRKKGNRSFKSDLIEIEANQVDKILVFPKIMNGKQVELVKENGNWFASAEGKKFNADKSTVESIINNLDQMKAESVASAKKDRWGYYEVTDSTGTRVQLFDGSDLLADVYLGKFSFSGQRKATSYVRLADENETYGVDGFLASSVNRDLSGFKSKSIINTSKDNWGKLTFSYPADSSFIIQKEDDSWQIPNFEADSAEVVKFLSSIENLNHYRIAKKDPTVLESFTLGITGENEFVEVKGYQESDNQFIVSSSQNPGTYFEGNDLKDKLFPPRTKFQKSE